MRVSAPKLFFRVQSVCESVSAPKLFFRVQSECEGFGPETVFQGSVCV